MATSSTRKAVREIGSLVKSKSPDWADKSQEEVERMRSILEGYWFSRIGDASGMLTLWVVAATFVLGLVFNGFGVMDLSDGRADVLVLFELVAGSGLMAGWIGILWLLMWWAVDAACDLGSLHARVALVSLSESPRMCVEAQQFLEAPQALAYRDRAIATGRELLVIDYEVMERLHKEWTAASQAEQEQLACRRLHGLEVDAAAAKGA